MLLDLQGQVTGGMRVLTDVLLVPRVESEDKVRLAGGYLQWFIERDYIVLVCPDGHEMGLVGGPFDKHQLDETGLVDHSVKCPAEGCRFHQIIKLLEYDPSWRER